VATPIPPNVAPLTVWSAAAATGGHPICARDSDAVSRGVVSDSRAVTPGCTFVALRGQHQDGHDYLQRAIDAGATLLVVEQGRAIRTASAEWVEVPNTLIAWGDLGRAHLREWRRRRRDARTIAITGSAGKTTTKELCAALLRGIGECHAAPGNLNNRIGVPAVAFGLEPRHRFAVFEAGMSERGEIAELGRLLEPDVAVITNIGVAHAQGVGGDRGDVAREKGDLFAVLAPDSTAVACHDDAAAIGQFARTHARHFETFGRRQGATYRLLERVSEGSAGSFVRAVRAKDGSELAVHLPLLGEAAAVDFCGALAAVESLAGPLDPPTVEDALRSRLRMPDGRMSVRRLVNGTIVLDDSYNANPQSVRAALQTLVEIAGPMPRVVVLGEMRELGDIGPQEHLSIGGLLAAAGVRLGVSCGGLADLAILSAASAGMPAVLGKDTDGARRHAVEGVAAGDVVLVKASRGVGAEQIVEALVRAGGGEVGVPDKVTGAR
jgi:UDP-N-acetylmuramoyl-tripeptide--D-alanyl-D-alanine ligase